MNGTKTSHRNGRIDFLRFAFALIIMLHHSRYLLGDDNCYFLGGSLGVEFFFLVSGYLMMASVSKITRKVQSTDGSLTSTISLADETASFIGRKARGILPQFPIAWFIGLFVVIIFNGLTFKEGIVEFVDDFWELTLLKMTGIFDRGLDGVMWYVSSMLICMTILYPLMRRFPDFMRKIWCPLIAVMLLGLTCRLDGHPRNPAKWYGIIYKGNIRAFAEICLGIWIYDIVRKMKSVDWTMFARILFEILQVIGYACAVLYMYTQKPGMYDYFFLVVLTGAVILSFAGTGVLSKLYDNRLSYLLGRFSTALFFSHIYYAQNLNAILPDGLSKIDKTIVYILCSFATAAVVEVLSSVWKKISPYILGAIHRSLIADA